MASSLVASQHTDRKCKGSSDVQLAQPKLKKKSPAQVARDRARRKEFWKRMRLPRQLRAENFALHYIRLEAQKEASPQSSVVSQPESYNSSCLDRTSDGSKSYQLQETETSSRYLTIEREVVNTPTAQVQSDFNKLSAVEHSSISVDKCDDSEILCTGCLKKRKFDSFTSLYRL